MHYSRHGSGLVVAENAADERSVGDALREFDSSLVLTWEIDPDTQRQVWEVHALVSRDRPAVFVCRWQNDYGEPLPLSHRLVDLVKQLRHGTLSADADRRNEKLRAAEERDFLEAATEVFRDGLPKVLGKKMTVLPRSQSLRRARHKSGGRWSS